MGSKATKNAERLLEAGDELTEEESTQFRALAARGNHLALDRPELAYASKELCRHFSQPGRNAVLALKRLVRFIIGAPRLVWKYEFQKPTETLRTYVGTDFGGCVHTRRSTSGGVAMRGTHILKHWSATQSTVCLSSGEAKLGGICPRRRPWDLELWPQIFGSLWISRCTPTPQQEVAFAAEGAWVKSGTWQSQIYGYKTLWPGRSLSTRKCWILRTPLTREPSMSSAPQSIFT